MEKEDFHFKYVSVLATRACHTHPIPFGAKFVWSDKSNARSGYWDGAKAARITGFISEKLSDLRTLLL